MYGPELLCPLCKGRELHQTRYEIFARNEDAKCQNMKVDAKTGSISFFRDGNDHNPSLRRQGLRINFMCEQGCEVPDLCILQHKGLTMVTWSNGETLDLEQI